MQALETKVSVINLNIVLVTVEFLVLDQGVKKNDTAEMAG